MIEVKDLELLEEGDVVLFKLKDEYFPIEIKYVVNKSLSKYIVGVDGCMYSLKDLYMKAE